jgi:hypothetical protein
MKMKRKKTREKTMNDVRVSVKEDNGRKVTRLVEALNPRENGGEAILVGVEIEEDSRGDKYDSIFIDAICYGTHSTRMSISGVTLKEFIDVLTRLHESRIKAGI